MTRIVELPPDSAFRGLGVTHAIIDVPIIVSEWKRAPRIVLAWYRVRHRIRHILRRPCEWCEEEP